MKDKKRLNDVIEVWELVDKSVEVVCKQIFKRKISYDGSVRYCGRLVASGYIYSPGMDCQETYAPEVRYSIPRMLIVLFFTLEKSIRQLDVVTAFLNTRGENDNVASAGILAPGTVRYSARLAARRYI